MSTMSSTAFCKYVENRLGWSPPNAPYKYKYMAEAKRVEENIADNPELFTYDNLKAAVELLARERKFSRPSGVFVHVVRALNLVRDKEVDLDIDIRHAMSIEAAMGDPNGWVERLARAVGPYRTQALQEWRSGRAS